MSLEIQALQPRKTDHHNRFAAEALATIMHKPVALPQDTISAYDDENINELEIKGVAPTRVQQSILGTQPHLTPPLVNPSDHHLDREFLDSLSTSRDHHADLFRVTTKEVSLQRANNKKLHADHDAIKDQIESQQKSSTIASLIKKISGLFATLFGIGSIGLSIATAGIAAPLLVLPAVAGLFSAVSGATQKIFEIELDMHIGKSREHKELISLNQKKIAELMQDNQATMHQAHDLWKTAMALLRTRNIRFF
jgi:hypothetical protein